ncbi:DUF6624 domain-containing protein [Caulobacter hibisci]|uniref:DUF4893 domain-containing protein n=1 Tax=Caulobacter hibisci TaxID=2035993 RepID=A0ABS0SUB9_9CAUL|nr:DUF6624 domain-containing protein [Caulobacter hibisci]MBI1683213.1 hypothetical protein [Caulobacter hibisci]
MLELLIAAAMLAQTTAAPAPALVSPEARALIASVQASIDQEQARQAALPLPKDDAERLVRLGRLDQIPRRVALSFDYSTLPQAERDAAMRAAFAPIEAQDKSNREALLALLPPEGWFLRSRYGDKAATSAFHIIQHADTAAQERFLPALEPLVRAGEFEGQNYGMMFDRVATSNGRQQRYGTQFRCDGGKWRPYPIEDEAGLEARRALLAFPDPYAEYKARMQSGPPCPQTRSPPPPGMKLD